MQKGFWNYTQVIEYHAVIVKIKRVYHPPMHWQNAFIGQEREAIQVFYPENGKMTSFLIDNEDGSGLVKILSHGGPGSMHRSIDSVSASIVRFVEKPRQWDAGKCMEIEAQVEAWGKENCPEEWEKLQRLKEAWEHSPFKKLVDETRKNR